MVMKQMILSMMLLLSAVTMTAQDKQGKAINEKFFDAKVCELVCRLNMTDEQKGKFIPIYRRYNEEMRAVWEGHRHKGKPTTDEERLARTKQRMERQQKVQGIRMKYIDEFATALTADQVSRFYEEEGRIMQKLMERKSHPHHMEGPHEKPCRGEKGMDRK